MTENALADISTDALQDELISRFSAIMVVGIKRMEDGNYQTIHHYKGESAMAARLLAFGITWLHRFIDCARRTVINGSTATMFAPVTSEAAWNDLFREYDLLYSVEVKPADKDAAGT